MLGLGAPLIIIPYSSARADYLLFCHFLLLLNNINVPMFKFAYFITMTKRRRCTYLHLPVCQNWWVHALKMWKCAFLNASFYKSSWCNSWCFAREISGKYGATSSNHYEPRQQSNLKQIRDISGHREANAGLYCHVEIRFDSHFLLPSWCSLVHITFYIVHYIQYLSERNLITHSSIEYQKTFFIVELVRN